MFVRAIKCYRAKILALAASAASCAACSLPNDMPFTKNLGGCFCRTCQFQRVALPGVCQLPGCTTISRLLSSICAYDTSWQFLHRLSLPQESGGGRWHISLFCPERSINGSDEVLLQTSTLLTGKASRRSHLARDIANDLQPIRKWRMELAIWNCPAGMGSLTSVCLFLA